MAVETNAHGPECGCRPPTMVVSSPPDDRVTLDVRGLDPPEPFDRTIMALEHLGDDVALEQMVDRVPVFLLPYLSESGFGYSLRPCDDSGVCVTIWRLAPGETGPGLQSGPAEVTPDDGLRESPDGSTVLDARVLPPRAKHPAIFDLFDTLRPGEAFVLLNDHDPKPLRFQFDAQRPAGFTWDYLEAGPEEWRVRIGCR